MKDLKPGSTFSRVIRDKTLVATVIGISNLHVPEGAAARFPQQVVFINQEGKLSTFDVKTFLDLWEYQGTDERFGQSYLKSLDLLFGEPEPEPEPEPEEVETANPEPDQPDLEFLCAHPAAEQLRQGFVGVRQQPWSLSLTDYQALHVLTFDLAVSGMTVEALSQVFHETPVSIERFSVNSRYDGLTEYYITSTIGVFLIDVLDDHAPRAEVWLALSEWAEDPKVAEDQIDVEVKMSAAEPAAQPAAQQPVVAQPAAQAQIPQGNVQPAAGARPLVGANVQVTP